MRAAALAVVLLALLLASSAAAASAPGAFVGMYSEDAFYRGADYRDAAFAAQARAGIGLERFPFDWREIETAPGAYDFSRYDDFVGAAARAGLEVLPVVGDSPLFRSGAPALTPTSTWFPPLNVGDYAQFVRVLIARYGPGGAFWAAHRELRPMPIANWQLWNEPNLPMFWGLAPNAAQYVRLLKAGAAAVHGADPGATVVSAGLPESTAGVPLGEYVDELYAAGFKGSFDVFGLHGYAPGLTGTVDLTDSVREMLDDHGDQSPIWITEFGWATGGISSWFSVSEAEQAQRIGATLSTLWTRRAQLRLRGVIVFKWRDAVRALGQADAWPLYTGMLRTDGSAKPALGALSQAIAGMNAPVATGGSGSAAAPTRAPAQAPAAALPPQVKIGDLVVRWVQVAGRRARLHATCAKVGGACSGRLAASAGRKRTGARRYRVGSSARVVLALGLSKRIPLARRWMTVRVVSDAHDVPAQAPRTLLIRRLR